MIRYQSMPSRLADQVSEVTHRALRRENIRLTASQQRSISDAVGEDAALFLSEHHAASTPRQAHDALRRLWRYTHREDCDAARLVTWLRRLPPRARAYVDRRAKVVVPKLTEGARADAGAAEWAQTVAASDVIKVVRVLAAEGGQRVQGRPRGPAKRSKAKLEPLILSTVRGRATDASRGGRPRHEAQDRLVTNLALDWLHATGELPQAGRSDRTGFGELVHDVFQIVGQTGATQALRRHFGNRPRN